MRAKWSQNLPCSLERGLKSPDKKMYIYIYFVGSLQTSLLCIVGELTEGGSVAVDVGFGDM